MLAGMLIETADAKAMVASNFSFRRFDHGHQQFQERTFTYANGLVCQLQSILLQAGLRTDTIGTDDGHATGHVDTEVEFLEQWLTLLIVERHFVGTEHRWIEWRR